LQDDTVAPMELDGVIRLDWVWMGWMDSARAEVEREREHAWLAGDHISVHLFSWVMLTVMSYYATSNICLCDRSTKIVSLHSYS
jgi:hypothetical protein